jgi:hypothetical protein
MLFGRRLNAYITKDKVKAKVHILILGKCAQFGAAAN